MIASFLARRLPFYYGWVIVAVSGCSMLARNAAGSLTLSVFFYPMSRDLGWSRTVMAGGSSIGGLLSILGSPISGWASDRIGCKWVMVCGVFVLGVSTFCLGLVRNIHTFYVVYGLGRLIFIGPIPIAASVVVSRWFIKRRGRATGLLFLFQSIGMAVLPYVAALFIQTNGWRETWMLMGVLVWSVALLPVIFFIIQTPEDVMLKPDNTTESEAIQSDESSELDIPDWTLQQAVRTKSLWLFAISTGIMFLIQSGTNVHQAAYFMDQQLSITAAALAVSITGVTAGVSSVLWGWLVERFRCRLIFVSVAITMCVSVGLFPLIHGSQQAIVYSAIFGLSVGGILVVPPVVYADYYGRTSLGIIRGVTEPFIAIGQAIGPILSGYIFDVTDSYNFAFRLFALMALLSSVLIFVSGDTSRKYSNK